MSRVFTQTLIRRSHALVREQPSASRLLPAGPLSLPRPPCARLLSFRGRSGRPDKPLRIFDVELEPAVDGGAASSPDATVARGKASARARARRLDSLIHGVLVLQSAPDWLPFIPGSSYWVPPTSRSEGLLEFLRQAPNIMTEEEAMSLTTERGYPCAEHLVGDVSPDPVDKNTQEASITSEGEDV